jgi:phage gp29-like protein
MVPGVLAGTRDQDGRMQWEAPNGGRLLLSTTDTFINNYSSLASVYRNPDEAMIDSHYNARAMLTDVGTRECIESRMRSVALLNWHIEPENDKSDSQVEFCGLLEKVVRRITHFTKYREACQWAIWYGKYGMQHRWGVQIVDGKSIYMPTPRHQDDPGWQQINGDKLVFRQRMASGNMPPGGYEGQLGIRVGYRYSIGDIIRGRWTVEGPETYSPIQATDFGLAYFLTPGERRLMLVHKHKPEDAAYEDGLRAGSVYGLGIRSAIYWEWKQKQETMAFMMEFIERMAGGIQIWRYPTGNQQAFDATKEAATNYNSGQSHALLVPVPPGDIGQYDVTVHEPGFGGIEILQSVIHEYFSHRIKRYILGQILSSESDATGLGSGVAELHQDTLLQILKYDAINLEETLTSDLLLSIIRINVDRGVWADPGFRPKFAIETESSDSEKVLEGWMALLDRGLKFRKKDLYDLVGAAAPTPEDDVLGMESNGPQSAQPFNPNGAMQKPPSVNGEDPDADTEKNAAIEPVKRYKRFRPRKQHRPSN